MLPSSPSFKAGVSLGGRLLSASGDCQLETALPPQPAAKPQPRTHGTSWETCSWRSPLAQGRAGPGRAFAGRCGRVW